MFDLSSHKFLSGHFRALYWCFVGAISESVRALRNRTEISTRVRSHLGHVVGGVGPRSLRIYPAHLAFVVVDELYSRSFKVVQP